MRLTAVQKLRRELLQFALGKQPEIEAAIELASRMEKFVLEGRRDDSGALPQQRELATSADVTSASAVIDEVVQSGPPCQNLHEADAPAGGQANSESSPKKRRWSSEDDAELKRLWHSALSLEEIAGQLDRTVPSLYSRARAQGYGRRDQEVPGGHCNGTGRHEGGPEPESMARAPTAEKAGTDAGTTAEVTASEAPKMPRGRKVVDRYPAQNRGAKTAAAGGWRSGSRTGGAQSAGISKLAGSDIEVEFGVEPIIQFLRSRDYSVVRAEDGRFRIDGRYVMDVDQLREKANKVRKSLGLALFAQEFIGTAE